MSVQGPSDWNNIVRRHREVLNISLDPPETKRILLKTKNFVNASLLKLSGKGVQLVARRLRQQRSRYKNPLALRKSCDIFAPVCLLRASLTAGNSQRASVGKAKNPTGGSCG